MLIDDKQLFFLLVVPLSLKRQKLWETNIGSVEGKKKKLQLIFKSKQKKNSQAVKSFDSGHFIAQSKQISS